MTIPFSSEKSYALKCDRDDPLKRYRADFMIPKQPNGKPVIYFCGNSLGLQPKGVSAALEQELSDWAQHGVEGHFKAKTPWYSYHEIFRDSGARIAGAIPGEVVMMNTLSVNLHLMMATFYRPSSNRYKIIIEDGAFPSDTYAVKSQIRHHGISPSALVLLKPRPGEHCLRQEDIERVIAKEGKKTALVLLGGVNFLTGQVLDMKAITKAAHKKGCFVGFDLAHGIGNIPVELHDWQVDFAVWCSYKYLNAGPGAIAGCFVHERHGKNTALPRLAGWWGNNPETRFKLQLIPEFVPNRGADGWQISNPPIFSLAPLKASLDLFGQAGMKALRRKSLQLTGYMQFLLDRVNSNQLKTITPDKPSERGAQISILVGSDLGKRHRALKLAGIIADFREPNIIRVAPVPFYNTFQDVWTFVDVLSRQP